MSELANSKEIYRDNLNSPNTEQFIFRHEFYGGLVHSRTDGLRYELSHEYIAFLEALDTSGDIDIATFAVRLAIPGAEGFNPDINELSRRNLLTESSGTREQNNNLDSVTEIIVSNYKESKTRDYLRAPVNLSVYPLMACQLSCKFCYVSPEKWEAGSRPVEDWIEVMVQARDAGTPFISFLGGDPALYKGMPRLVRACDEVGIKGTITTNGNYMSSELLSALVDTDKITPVVSIQSLDDFHESITGRPVSEPIDTLGKLHESGTRCNVNMVYTEQSYDQVEKLVDFCNRVGAGKFTIGVFTDINDSHIKVPSFSDYRKLHEHISSYIEAQGYDVVFQTEGCQLYTAYPELDYKAKTHYQQLTLGCDAGQGRCEIMHDGSILGCALLDKDKWGGLSVFEYGYQEAWDKSQELSKIREIQNRDEACNSGQCGFSDFCNGGCPAHNERLYGDPEAGGDQRCEIRSDILATDALSSVINNGRARLPVLSREV